MFQNKEKKKEKAARARERRVKILEASDKYKSIECLASESTREMASRGSRSSRTSSNHDRGGCIRDDNNGLFCGSPTLMTIIASLGTERCLPNNGEACRSDAISVPEGGGLVEDLRSIGIDDSSIIDPAAEHVGELPFRDVPVIPSPPSFSIHGEGGGQPKRLSHHSDSSTDHDSAFAFHDEEHPPPPSSFVGKPRQEEKPTRRKIPCWLLSLGAVVLTILVIIVILVLVTQFYRSGESDKDESRDPAESPRDSLPMEYYMLTLLPDYALANIDMEDDDSVSASPQTRAFHWLMNDPAVESYPDFRLVQRFALGTIYYATGGNRTWTEETNWMSYDHHENDWHWSLSFARHEFQHFPFDPVDFLRQGMYEEVTHLWLFNNSLSGTIPPEIGLLSHLKSIDLTGNKLVGSIPPQMGDLVQLLGLLLNMNELSGPIPSQLGNLQQLLWLTAFRNKLDSSIPSELGTLPLWSLQLDENGLTGALPSQLGRLSDILWLRLHSNALSGPIPSEVGLMTALQMVDLSENQFSSSLPSELGAFQLANLDLSPYLKVAKQSIVLDLENIQFFNEAVERAVKNGNGNSIQIHSNALTGTIPTELSQLSFNGLQTCVSYVLGDQFKCNGLDLHNNLLSGSLPALSESLEYLDVSNNRLQGSIPSDLGYGSLQHLDASQNALTGTIPEEIPEWSALRVFNASFCRLTGTIPASSILSQQLLYSIASNETTVIPFDFDVSGNTLLSGTVPWEICALSNTNINFTCSEWLCGCSCPCHQQSDSTLALQSKSGGSG